MFLSMFLLVAVLGTLTYDHIDHSDDRSEADQAFVTSLISSPENSGDNYGGNYGGITSLDTSFSGGSRLNTVDFEYTRHNFRPSYDVVDKPYYTSAYNELESGTMLYHHRTDLRSALVPSSSSYGGRDRVERKCWHCGADKTPQWRAGPGGPRTLCNACGLKHRSGRLDEAYRPAASPSFDPNCHSNFHKQIKKRGLDRLG